MKKIALIVLLTFAVACKSDKKQSAEENNSTTEVVTETQNEIPSDNKFRLIFEGVFQEDDLLLVYYTTEKGQKITSDISLRKEIKGSNELQKITLVFEENQRPYNLRIDFSDNKKQKSVKLENIYFVDKYNKVTINSNNIENHFTFNNYMSFDKASQTLKGTLFKLNDKDAYNPYIVANKNFVSVLEQMNIYYKKKLPVTLIQDEYNINLNDDREHVIIKGTFKTDDLVLLFYAEDSLAQFKIEQTVRTTVKGSPKEQTVVLTLPQGVLTTKVRLDISDRKDQKGITLNTVNFVIGKSKLTISKQEFSKYFSANNYIELDKNTGDFTCKIIEVNGIENYNPYFISTPELIKELIDL